MKRKLILIVCSVSILSASVNSVRAAQPTMGSSVADVLVARPLCFAATVLGSVAFVLCLPFSAASKSVKSTADVLVVAPANATFTRPIGDFEDMPE